MKCKECKKAEEEDRKSRKFWGILIHAVIMMWVSCVMGWLSFWGLMKYYESLNYAIVGSCYISVLFAIMYLGIYFKNGKSKRD